MNLDLPKDVIDAFDTGSSLHGVSVSRSDIHSMKYAHVTLAERKELRWLERRRSIRREICIPHVILLYLECSAELLNSDTYF